MFVVWLGDVGASVVKLVSSIRKQEGRRHKGYRKEMGIEIFFVCCVWVCSAVSGISVSERCVRNHSHRIFSVGSVLSVDDNNVVVCAEALGWGV